MSGQLPVILLGLWKTVVLIYDVITLPFFLVIQKPWLILARASKPRAKLERFDDPYSSWLRTGTPADTEDIFGGKENLAELYRHIFKKLGREICYGYRKVFGEEEEKQPNGKVFKKLILDDKYTWVSFEKADQQIEDLAAGLWSSGIRSGDRVIIFAETRPEWMLCLHAIFRLGATAATLYSTLGDEGVIHGINEQEATHVITSSDLLGKIAKIKSSIPKVSTVVYMESLHKKNKVPEVLDTKLVSYSQVLEEGHGVTNLPIPKMDSNEIAVMMYTSGSTGVPKAVMISHRNMFKAIESVIKTVMIEMELSHDDTFLAYLPQAHIFEMACELSLGILGIKTAYSSVLTMTDNSTGVKRGCKGDVFLAKPTIMPSVPLILDRIRKEAVNKIQKNGRLLKGIFEFSLDYKTFWTRKGFNTPLINRFVFNKIKAMMGGRLRFMLVGGAPLSPETQEFAANCLDCKIFQGYAATETAAAATIMDKYDLSYGRVGAPLYGVKLRLKDWREGGYFATDRPNPRGEVVIGGDALTLGYYKNEEETNRVYFEEDGVRWWSTGDIGEIYPDGNEQSTFLLILFCNSLQYHG
jgi:long-chain acyl-CoA synthetase